MTKYKKCQTLSQYDLLEAKLWNRKITKKYGWHFKKCLPLVFIV